jgi:D-3-phosphoglycerate dehydrogenase
MKKVLIADPLSEQGIAILKEHVLVDVKTGLSPEELKNIISGYDGIIVRSQTQVTASIIETSTNLQVIGRAGVGVDNIDLAAATKRGIIVVNAPTGNTISAAEHAIALLLSLARHIPNANASLKSGAWKRSSFMGTEVRGKTLGIIGLGNVGSEVAKRAKGLAMNLLGYDPFISPERASNLNVKVVSIEELLKQSDFITLHIPLLKETKELIGEEEFKLVKPTMRIINTARGGLIDEKALLKAISEERVAGAAIDVFEKEPCTDSLLFANDKIIVTPHLGASTKEAQSLAASDVAQQILDIFDGKPAQYAVNTPIISSEAASFIIPFIKVADALGKLSSYLGEGHLKKITIKYQGDIASYDTNALRAVILGGLLNRITEERVNMVNANAVAAKRGIKVLEEKEAGCDNYANLLTLELNTSDGDITVSGTLMRGEPHIVRVNNFWIDIVPSGGYFLFVYHIDRPGLIGSVGSITGEADINISYMHLSRLKPRGEALMILAVDEPINAEQNQKILSLPEVYSAKMVNI